MCVERETDVDSIDNTVGQLDHLSSLFLPCFAEQVVLRASDLRMSRERVIGRYQLPKDRSSRFDSTETYSSSSSTES